MADRLPAITPPPDYKLGPMMQRLNPRQQAFVIGILEFGGINHVEAAVRAGYKNDEAIYKTARRLAHDEDVLNAIEEEARRRLRSGAIMGVSVLLEIANDQTKKDADRLKAIEMTLNRVGLHAVTEHKVDVTHTNLTSDDMIKKITLLAKNQGLDPAKLLGNLGVTIDAEFVEVTEAEKELADIL